MIILLAGFAGLLLIATVLPFLPVAHGLVRVCDFPRLQIAALAALLVALIFWLRPFGGGDWPVALLLLLVIGVQIAHCLPFTPVWRVQSLRYDGQAGDTSVFRILAANVKMSNRQYGRMLDLVQARDPDIAIFMEVDEAWTEALAPLSERLPNIIQRPQDNAYGMALFSRLALSESEVRCLVIDEVPSIRTKVMLPDGQAFRLYALHPEPPVPYEDTLGRDGEIILVAKEIIDDPLPKIATGDLNDVAWSRTTRRFQRLAGMLDPRVGRGFYNSFDARFWFLRWPLDHLFHDARFRLVCLERLPSVGSDHFPMLFELALTAEPAAEIHPEEPDAADVKEARSVVREASKLEREPIGADWEK